MRVMKSSGQGDENIIGDEHEEEVPGNEKKDEEKLDGFDAVHRGIVWPDKWPYNSHPATPKTFLNDWPYVDRYRRNIDYKPEFNTEPPSMPALPEPPAPTSSDIAAGVGVSVIIFFIIVCRILYCCTKIHSACYEGSDQATSVVRPRPAQQHRQTHMPPPRQAEAVPPYMEMPPPYFDCNNVNVSAPLKDSEPLLHNNGLVETGLRNEYGAMTTTPYNASRYVNTEFV